ncbi:MAG: hypothetical protein MPW14_12590 [Candidatus Manganitrophus sp.]|nr:MAG: hypothetical protein MPW14_12590 [Candidatus Manganitrophus sp.]
MSKKWILFLFAALFLLFFTVQLVLQSGLFSEKAKAYAEKGLERLLGRPIQIGEVELRSLSASVVLKGVSARPIGDVSPFSAQEIRVYFSPWSLLTQSFFIRQIVIESPSIALTPALLSQPPPPRGSNGRKALRRSSFGPFESKTDRFLIREPACSAPSRFRRSRRRSGPI